MSVGLTRQQAALLAFIVRYEREHGLMPSFDEMNDGMGLRSKSGIHRLITALVERGRLKRMPNRARALELVERSDEDGILVRLRPDQSAFLTKLARRDLTTPDAIVRELVTDLMAGGT